MYGQEQYQVDEVVDSKTLNLRFDGRDDQMSSRGNSAKGMTCFHAEEGNTGVNCVASVETLIVSKMPVSPVDFEVPNTRTMVIEPPKTVSRIKSTVSK